MAIQTVKTGTAVNDGTGDDARTAFTKINQNFSDSANAASRLVGTATGSVMEVGAFGIGSSWDIRGKDYSTPSNMIGIGLNFGFANGAQLGIPNTYANVIFGHSYRDSTAGYSGAPFILSISSNEMYLRYSNESTSDWLPVRKFYSTGNTTVDGNGFIKAASPIVQLFADKIELNNEAAQQKITFEKLGVGDYLIKGSTGFAQEGWYVEMPKDANGNVLVAVVYKQLDNNDISVKTYAKKFDEETGDIVANIAKPRDIPATRWIDLRLQALPQDDTQPFDTDETVVTNAE